jgi:hypothetical protein
LSRRWHARYVTRARSHRAPRPARSPTPARPRRCPRLPSELSPQPVHFRFNSHLAIRLTRPRPIAWGEGGRRRWPGTSSSSTARTTGLTQCSQTTLATSPTRANASNQARSSPRSGKTGLSRNWLTRTAICPSSRARSTHPQARRAGNSHPAKSASGGWAEVSRLDEIRLFRRHDHGLWGHRQPVELAASEARIGGHGLQLGERVRVARGRRRQHDHREEGLIRRRHPVVVRDELERNCASAVVQGDMNLAKQVGAGSPVEMV